MTRTDTEKPLAPELSWGAPLVRVYAPEGRSCEASKPVVLVGGRRDCDLYLSAGEVSKLHCALVNTGRAVLICDLNSRSGTFLNDQAVRVAVVRASDALRIGSIVLRTEFLQPGPGLAADEDVLAATPPIRISRGDTTFTLLTAAALIGRRSTCDVFIDHPDVSLAHALVFLLNGRPAICDLGSRSGTLLNGSRVASAWLSDGDRLILGGEEWRVEWKAAAAKPAPAVAAPAPAVGPAVNAVRASAPRVEPVVHPPAMDANDGMLDEFERTIAMLHSQVASKREEIDRRAVELDRRETEIESLRATYERRCGEVDQREKSLEKREARILETEQIAQEKLAGVLEQERALKMQAAALEQQATALAEQNAAIELHAQEVGQKADELAAREAELVKQAAALAKVRREAEAAAHDAEQAREALQTERTELEQERAALAAQAAELTELREQLDQRDVEIAVRQEEVERLAADQLTQTQELELARRMLEQRESELVAREEALRAREAAEADSVQKIERFKSVLRQATEMFAPDGQSARGQGGADEPDSAVGGGRTPNAPPVTPSIKPAARGGAKSNGHAHSNGHGRTKKAERSARGVQNGLPAPLVDAPIFAGPGGGPPADWPTELQERYRVLRRVSEKSDEELLAQLWSEHRGSPADSKRRSKRRWWA